MASKGTVEEAQRNSEIIKVIWPSVVKDLTGDNQKRKETKEPGQPHEDISRRNVNQR